MIHQGAKSQLPLWFGNWGSNKPGHPLQAVEEANNEIRKSVKQWISIQAMYKQELFQETHQESPTAIHVSINQNQQENRSKQEEAYTNILSESWHKVRSSKFLQNKQTSPNLKAEEYFRSSKFNRLRWRRMGSVDLD